MTPKATKAEKILLGILLAAACFLFLFRLGNLALYDYDEAHYAQVVQQTLASDDLLTFKRFNTEWFEKPPLLLWLTMASVKIFGINEFAMRLPTALFGILGIYGTYLLAFVLTKNRFTALSAGFVLLLSGMFPASGRQLRMDVPAASAIVWAVYSFVKSWEKPKYYLGFWVWTAVGVLLKSVVGLFAWPISFIFSAICKQWGWLKNRYFYGGILIFLFLVVPWHIYETGKFGSRFWSEYFGFHIFRRATEKILGGNVTTFDYLKHLLILNEPWFILTIILGGVTIFYSPRLFSCRAAAASLLSVLFIFFVFILARTKLMFYLVPILPFEALFIAASAFYLWQNTRWRQKKKFLIGCGSVMFLIAAVSTAAQLFYYRAPYSYSYAGEERAIGNIIKERMAGHSIYSYDWKSYETIYFYSEQTNRIQLVSREELERGFPMPYFLIIPRLYLPSSYQPGTSVLYRGPNLALVEVSKKASKN
ncbi:MAG: glycosyltransferase family 39 protein [Candidatus Sungbacteria bacterium]|nr:glycosyltransferase family 39 protein [Candidatus Sungbacteria bacterium]